MPVTVQPLAEAVAHHGAKTPVGSVLRTREWAKMPRALRQRAQFAAGVESARYLQRVQDGIGKVLSQEKAWDRSRVVRDLMDIADREGLRPGGKELDGLLDPGSERRTELIYSMQTQQAYGHAEWKAGQDPDALDAAPAQELIRVEDRKVPRDWVRRWAEAGGRLYDGRMVALKTDPIWERISRFTTPWPPFDFGSGMGVEDVLRSEAEELGVLPVDAPAPTPTEADFNAGLEADVSGLGPELRLNLQSLFGSQIDVAGEKVKWNVGQAEAYESDRANIRQTSQRVFRGVEEAYRGMGLGDMRAEGDEDAQRALADWRATARGWAAEISAVATGRKPLYHEGLGWFLQPDALERLRADVQQQLPQGVIAGTEDHHFFVYNPVAISRLADPSRQLRPQVLEHTDDGTWLGYGVNLFQTRGVRVAVVGPDGNQVAGFVAPRHLAELYGAARARDWVDSTGLPHTYVLED